MKSTALVRALAALVIATMMGALMSFVAAPDAAANHDSDYDFFVPADGSGGTCEGLGLTTGGSSFSVGGGVEFSRCIYAPSSRLTTQVQCEAAGGAWQQFDNSALCSPLAAPLTTFDAGVCPPGWQAVTFAGDPGCALMLRTAHAGNIYKPICIEDSMLQDDPAFADLRINGEIQADASTAYFVQSGEGCTFDCADGFDANCDGKFGDYCRVEIDRKVVSGAGTCIAELGPAVQPLPPVVVHDVATTLAHTGAETSVIAFFGLGLTAFGATAMGLRRRLG